MPQSREVLQWIAQAVGMIDPNSIEDTFAKPLKNAAMCRFEDVRPFNPETDERVHVEESAIAQFLVGRAPIRQSVVLKIQQFIESIVIRIQLANCLVDRLQCVSGCSSQNRCRRP